MKKLFAKEAPLCGPVPESAVLMESGELTFITKQDLFEKDIELHLDILACEGVNQETKDEVNRAIQQIVKAYQSSGTGGMILYGN